MMRQYHPELPVFTVSSREYMRHRGVSTTCSDGAAPCCDVDQILWIRIGHINETLEFASIEDTGIAALQEWCHTLTLPVREEDARKAMEDLRAFATTLRTYIAGAPQVAEAERKSLRVKWESTMYRGSWGDEKYVKDGALLDASEQLWARKGIVWRLVDVSTS